MPTYVELWFIILIRCVAIYNYFLCGEPIEVDVIETIDKTEEAEKVSEVATKLRKQLWACDSKKKCAELEKEIRNLDDIVNYYYSTGEIDENRENQKIVEK